MRTAGTFLAALLVLAMVGSAQQVQVDIQAERTAIRDAADVGMLNAAKEKNVEGILAYYTDDASMLPPNAPIARGKQAVRAIWTQLLANPEISWQTTKVEVSSGGDLAYSTGTYNGRYSSSEREGLMGNIEVIKGLYQALAEKDYDAFRQICHPQVEWILNKGFPHGRRHVGAEAIIENVFKVLTVDWENWHFEIKEYLDAGDTVVVIGTYTGTHRTTGKSFTAAAAHVYDLQGGKVVKFRQFTDTQLIVEAMS